MRYSCVIILLLLAFCWSSDVHAQKRKLKKANELFEQFSFPEAADLYKKILAKKNNDEAIQKLAECYRLMNKPVEAEYWYEQVIELPNSTDIDLLHYGMALKMNGKYDLAREVFLEYAQLVPADTRGLRLVESCDKAEYFTQDPGVYNIDNVTANSGESDFGPAFYEDGIVFASARGGKYQDKVYNWTGKPFLDLFYADCPDKENPGNLGKPELFKGQANTWMHEGTVTFAKDQQTMFFTRNNFHKGKKRKDDQNTIRLKIFSSNRDGDKWSDIKDLTINSDLYSVGHPSLTNDGNTMYFTSDMPGGYGEEDIYVSRRSGGDASWGTPENLGPEINTEGREMFPFISDDGTLYFASDALPGLGGLDIFTSQYIENGWTPPENLRAPINTNYDDFGLILDGSGEYGYFSSNRAGGKGDDDIYAFTRSTFMLNGVVVDSETQEPIEGALVQLIENGVVLQERTTYANGEFSFPVGRNSEYEIRVTKPNYADAEQPVSTFNVEGNSLDIKVEMDPESMGGIHCELRGLVYENETGVPVPGATVKLINSETKFEKTYVTGEDGTYFFEIDPETDYLVFATKELYFTATKSVSTKGRDCSAPLQKDLALDIGITKIVVDEEDPQTLNEIDEFQILHIYYDLDKSFIRSDAGMELDKVVKIMYENPGILIELGSHTDSRASDSYNSSLSQRRADAAVEYIVSKGIQSDRITARGYGESQLVNRCSNGVTCSDIEHQENRRTEFTISGYRDNAIYSVPRYFGAGFEPSDDMSYIESDGGSEGDNADNTDNTEMSEDGQRWIDVTDGKPTVFDEPEEGNETYQEATYVEDGGGSSTSFDSGSDISSGMGVEYKIQLGAYKRHVNMTLYEGLRDLGFIDVEEHDGVSKVVLGAFEDRGFAESIQSQIRARGIGDAFIVEYRDGMRQ